MAILDDKQFTALINLIRLTIDDAIDKKLDERLEYLPTKDEFYESQDELMTEVKAIRENQDVQSKQTSRNSDRIEKLEKIHPSYRHQ